MRALLVAGFFGLALLASGCFFNVTSYQEPDGSTVYVGEVQNDGNPLVGAYVTGTFYDGAGNVIATEDGPVCRVMPSKSVAAFKVKLPPGTAKPARVDWQLNGREVDDAYLADGLSAVLLSSGDDVPPDFIETHYGEMTNNSTNTYVGGYGCVAWLNASGEVVRVGELTAVGLRFRPGDKLPFLVRENLPPEVTDAIFFLDAGVTPPGFPQPQVIDLPMSSFINATYPLGKSSPISVGMGEIRNSGSQAILPAAIVTTRDPGGKLNGVGGSGGICDVPAPAGGSTYLGYFMTSAAPWGTPSDVRLEASVIDPLQTPVFPKVSDLKKSTVGAGLVKVTGKVTNASSVTLSRVKVCAVALDSAGDVIGIFPGDADVGAGLAPGGTATFAVEVPPFGTVSKVDAVAAGFK